MISVLSFQTLTMVDENGFLADDDTLSRISGDDQGDLDDLDPPQGLDRDLYMSTDTSTTSGDEDEEEDQVDTNPGAWMRFSLLPRPLIGRELLR